MQWSTVYLSISWIYRDGWTAFRLVIELCNLYMADFSNQGPDGSRQLPKIEIIAILALRQSAPNMDRLSIISWFCNTCLRLYLRHHNSILSNYRLCTALHLKFSHLFYGTQAARQAGGNSVLSTKSAAPTPRPRLANAFQMRQAFALWYLLASACSHASRAFTTNRSLGN